VDIKTASPAVVFQLETTQSLLHLLSLSLLTSLLFLTSELSITFSDLLFLHHIFLGKEKAHVIVHFTTMEVKPLQIVPSSHNNNNTTGFIPLFSLFTHHMFVFILLFLIYLFYKL
jgi:hypothetical protein